jgi:hypothetical protein
MGLAGRGVLVSITRAPSHAAGTKPNPHRTLAATVHPGVANARFMPGAERICPHTGAITVVSTSAAFAVAAASVNGAAITVADIAEGTSNVA